MGRQSIVVFAQTPPPAHGQNRMVELELELLRKYPGRFDIHHINARFSRTMEDIGSRTPLKGLRVVKYLVMAFRIRSKLNDPTLYYVPGPVKWSAIIRDWAVLSVLRLIYQDVVFHWHAIGQGEWAWGSDRVTLPGPRTFDSIGRLLSRSVLRQPTRSIVVSEHSRQDAEAIRSNEIIVVPNGAIDAQQNDIEIIPFASDRPTRLLFLAHGTVAKGLLDLMEGLIELGKRPGPWIDSGLRVTMAGGISTDIQPEYEEKQRELINTWGGKLELVEVGYVEGESKAVCYADTDVFIAASHWESFGLTIVEAMSWGLPIVGAASDGVRGILGDDYPYLFPPKDIKRLVDRLANLLSALTSSGVLDLRKSLREKARKQFSIASFEHEFIRAIDRSDRIAPPISSVDQTSEGWADEEVIGHPNILQVFNQYLERGGEEIWVEKVEQLVESYSRIDTLKFQSQDWIIEGRPSRIQQAKLTWNNPQSRRLLREKIKREMPDVLIFHNILPIGSLGLYQEANDLGIPVVQYIHNFRPFSPSGTLWVKNRVDDSSLQGNMIPEVVGLAWKRSFLSTALLAFYLKRFQKTGGLNLIQHWIAVSDFMREKFIEAGVSPRKITTLRHCWEMKNMERAREEGDYYLFLGRLVPEKGIFVLIEAWALLERELGSACPELIVAGLGSAESKGRNMASGLSKIRFCGYVEGDEKAHLLAGCRALLVPSIWWEPLGLTVYEAYDYFRPVLAARSGGLTETVQDGVTGYQHRPGDVHDLLRTIKQMEEDGVTKRAEMGEAGRDWLQIHANPEAWREGFDAILKQACIF